MCITYWFNIEMVSSISHKGLNIWTVAHEGFNLKIPDIHVFIGWFHSISNPSEGGEHHHTVCMLVIITFKGLVSADKLEVTRVLVDNQTYFPSLKVESTGLFFKIVETMVQILAVMLDWLISYYFLDNWHLLDLVNMGLKLAVSEDFVGDIDRYFIFNTDKIFIVFVWVLYIIKIINYNISNLPQNSGACLWGYP